MGGFRQLQPGPVPRPLCHEELSWRGPEGGRSTGRNLAFRSDALHSDVVVSKVRAQSSPAVTQPPCTLLRPGQYVARPTAAGHTVVCSAAARSRCALKIDSDLACGPGDVSTRL